MASADAAPVSAPAAIGSRSALTLVALAAVFGASGGIPVAGLP